MGSGLAQSAVAEAMERGWLPMAAAWLLALGLLAACATTRLPPEAGPPRHVSLDHTLNTRDLGGYATTDGRQIRWRMLYRSDELDRLDENDLQVLAARDLRTVIDFRTEAERDGREDRLPEGVEPVWIPISYPSMDPDRIARRILRGDAAEGYFEEMMQRANRSFALDHGPEMAAFVEKLAEPGALPALFHCTYGKDRTGFGAALVLDLMGVPWETIQQDYLLSNVYLAENIDRMARFIWLGSLFRISQSNARDLLGVRAQYIASARNATIEEYGSTEGYLRAFGVSDETLQRLREALIE